MTMFNDLGWGLIGGQPRGAIRVVLQGSAALGGAIALFGCTISQPNGTSDATSRDRPQVVATTSVLCDLTQQIATDSIELTCLLSPGQDPHVYSVKPSDRKALEQADLILYDGYNYIPSLIQLITAVQSSAPKVAVYEAAVPEPLMGEAHHHDDHGHADHESEESEHHSDGEHHSDEEHAGETHAEAEHNDAAHTDADQAEADHPETQAESETGLAGADQDQVPDPHIWHNAVNNAAIAQVIADQLAALIPEQGETYRQNADRLTAEFTALDTWIQTQVDSIPPQQRKLVTTHDSFQYFATQYGLEVAGALSGLSTDEKPSAARLTALVKQITAAQVPAIFVEATTNPDLIQTVAKEAKVQVAAPALLVEGPDAPGSEADTVQEMLVQNTCTVVNALGGSCDPATRPE